MVWCRVGGIPWKTAKNRWHSPFLMRSAFFRPASRLTRTLRSQTATILRSPGAAPLLIMELSVVESLAQELRPLSAYVPHCRARIILESSIADRWVDPTGLATNGYAPSLQRQCRHPAVSRPGSSSTLWRWHSDGIWSVGARVCAGRGEGRKAGECVCHSAETRSNRRTGRF
jgi:hypothetical protein